MLLCASADRAKQQQRPSANKPQPAQTCVAACHAAAAGRGLTAAQKANFLHGKGKGAPRSYVAAVPLQQQFVAAQPQYVVAAQPQIQVPQVRCEA
jgi:hypothetical protein